MTSITLDDDLLDGVEQFIADRDEPQRGKMTYDDAISVIVRDWLMGQGYIALPDDADQVTPALKAARVPKS
ncbi:MAG: hypothetical protein WBA73_18390 [Devosia sp.]